MNIYYESGYWVSHSLTFSTLKWLNWFRLFTITDTATKATTWYSPYKLYCIPASQ